MKKLNKLKLGIIGALFGLAGLASAVVIQGEFMPGIYNNYVIDSLGRLPVVLSGGSVAIDTTSGPVNVTGTVGVSGTVPVSGSVGISGTPVVSITGTPNVNATLVGTPAVNASIVGTPTVNIGTMPVSTPPSYTYRNITANSTVTVKASAGTLKRLVVNTAGVTSTITVYDSTTGSGTKIGTATSLLAQSSIDYDVDFVNGLTVVAAGLTPADITVVYR